VIDGQGELFQITAAGQAAERADAIAARQMAMAARDEAVDRVERNADDGWNARALETVRRIPSGTLFTSDDLWGDGLDEPREPRALGAVMRAAQRGGLAVPTDSYRPSDRPVCHRNPKRVWRRA
jgi:hypothetical protein